MSVESSPKLAPGRDIRKKSARKLHLSNLGKPSALALIVANLVPLYGVVFLRWEVFPLVFLYWFENVIVGVFNVFRMVSTPPYDVKTWVGKVFLIPFFCVHYGMFTAIHGVFVMVLFGGYGYQGAPFPGPEIVAGSMKEYGLVLPAVVLFLSHGFSFVWNHLGRGEYKRAGLNELMARPYGRIVILHLTIIFGGFLIMTLGSPIAGLLLLVALKIGFDLKAHLREHARLSLRPGGGNQKR